MLRALPTATLLELKEEFARETSLQISRKDLCLHNGLGQVGGAIHLIFRYSDHGHTFRWTDMILLSNIT